LRRLALHKFHNQIIWPDVVDVADIRVIERGHGLGFTLEALRELFPRDLDRNVAIQTRVAGAIDLAHTAGANGRENLVRAELVTSRKGQSVQRVYRSKAKTLGADANRTGTSATDRRSCQAGASDAGWCAG